MSTIEIKDLAAQSQSKLEALRELILKGDVDFSRHVWSAEDLQNLRSLVRNSPDQQDAVVQAMASPRYRMKPRDMTDYYEYDNGMIRREGLYRKLFFGDKSASEKLYRQTWIEVCMFMGAPRTKSLYWDEFKKANTPEEFRAIFEDVYSREEPYIERTTTEIVRDMISTAYVEGARSIEDVYTSVGKQLQYEHGWAGATACLMADVKNMASLVHPIHLFVNRRSDTLAGRYLQIYGETFGGAITEAIDSATEAIDSAREHAKKNNSPYVFDYYDMSEAGDSIDAVLAALCWPDKLIYYTPDPTDNIRKVIGNGVMFQNTRATESCVGCWELKADLSYNLEYTAYLCAGQLISEFSSKKDFLDWASRKILPEYPIYTIALSAMMYANKLLEQSEELTKDCPNFQRFRIFGSEVHDWIAANKAMIDAIQSKEEIYETMEKLYTAKDEIGLTIMNFIKIVYEEILLDPVTTYTEVTDWFNSYKRDNTNKTDNEYEREFIYHRIIRDIAEALNPQE